ncbi:PepSY domain-containing protein [Kordia zhangzhouensis]|uniref:PepSY domain-containing protein n=1 Tax=Kordia zhangzhouensis TaxID=1620405 RepID=UPI00069C37B1|nr:PepSY domain-containing protein [Kordia zhangzhouensis]
MTISIWRYSHLLLAISSSLFITLASITGIILAFEPVSNQLETYAIHNLDNVSVATTITALQHTYKEVIELQVTNDNFVTASVITHMGDSETFYINPITGKKLGELKEKATLFKFATNLHRSLFLKSTGRFIVGIVSLLLFLLLFSGIILIAKRQGGVKRFFSNVVKENFLQYYHIQLGKLFFIPLAIITLTGIYLSIEKFSLLPNHQITHTTAFINNYTTKAPKDFPIFQQTTLSDVKSITFPFSKDVEDYFLVKLKNKELQIHQYAGEVLSSYEYPWVAITSYWSLLLHTGQGSILWAIVLGLACITLIFFMYSGFQMTLKRTKKQLILKNKFTKDEAEFIILVGSETGSTYRFAHLFFEALLSTKNKAFIAQLNDYNSFAVAKQLIVFTATYGDGDAPTNAKKFQELLASIPQQNSIKYSVIGFGSLMYPQYCKYAVDVENRLAQHPNFEAFMPLFKINNQSFTAFQSWANQWIAHTGIPLTIKQPKASIDLKKLRSFTVLKRSELNTDATFLIQLQPHKKQKFQSGDLLTFYPENDLIPRKYSIGKINNTIVLSIKRHEFGICSRYLSQQSTQDIVKAKIERNHEFHFPKYAKEIVMIANGTGIGPFLGMIDENKQRKKVHLFWGTRTKASTEIYKDILNEGLQNKQLTSLHIAYSQETGIKQYVQELIAVQAEKIASLLKNEGVIMICGSVAMQNQVLQTLEKITTMQLAQPLSDFEHAEQLKMDCY